MAHLRADLIDLSTVMRHVGADLGGPRAQMRSGMRADYRPERVILRAELRPKWSDFRFERADFRPEMVDFGLDRADLEP